MINQLCNIGNEQTETFYKLSIIQTKTLTSFNYLTKDATIESIISTLPDVTDVINVDLLPENLSLSYTSRVGDYDQQFNAAASFILTPLDKNLNTLLKSYNNREVILLLYNHKATYLYGTTQTPLVFTYNEQHSSSAQGLKGYAIDIRGEGIGASKQFSEVEFEIFNRGLAFQLQGSL